MALPPDPAEASAAPAAGGGLDFEALYRSSRDDVYAYVASIVREPSTAEDVTAQAFERAFRKRGRWSPQRGSARAWVFAIARNAALDELRRRKRHATLAADPEDEGAEPAHDAAESALRRTVLKDALAALDPRDRELVALKFFAGLSNGEIAEVIGVSESNAGTRLHRVITKLREACDEAA